MGEKEMKLHEQREQDLSELTSLGKQYMMEIASAAELVRLDILGQTQLSQEVKLQMLYTVVKKANEFSEIIETRMRSRQKLIDDIVSSD
jgi:Zn-finger domain-containing protein